MDKLEELRSAAASMSGVKSVVVEHQRQFDIAVAIELDAGPRHAWIFNTGTPAYQVIGAIASVMQGRAESKQIETSAKG